MNAELLFSLLADYDSALNVDVGAFVGKETVWLSCSGHHKVKAFEPFPTNVAYLTDAISKIAVDRAPQIIEKAVTDSDGVDNEKMRYLCGTKPIVDSGTGNWSDSFIGASSMGSLGDRASDDGVVPVETCTLTNEISEHVLMLNLKVQGGEMQCLKGAVGLIDSFGVDMILIDFIGRMDIVQFLHQKGYHLFDSDYMQWSVQNQSAECKSQYRSLMHTPEEITRLSNGMKGRRIFYPSRPSEPRQFVDFLHKFTGGKKDFAGQKTSLLAVHESAVEDFRRRVSAKFASRKLEKKVEEGMTVAEATSKTRPADRLPDGLDRLFSIETCGDWEPSKQTPPVTD